MVESNILYNSNIGIIVEADKFILVNKESSACISISKKFKATIKQETYDSKFEKQMTTIDGLLGMMETKDSNYLITISSSKLVGTILGHKVFKIQKLGYYPYLLTSEDTSADSEYIAYYNSFLQRNSLFYSPTFDLSASMLSIAKSSESNNSNILFEKSQTQYVWNLNMTKTIEKPELKDFIFPVINGFVSIKPVTCYDKEFTYMLISRKDHRRSGMRFLVRGADNNGYCGNFVETEQILAINNENNIDITSYVQIRGSIPLVWSQLPQLNLNPPININTDIYNHFLVFNKHMTALENSYEKITLVNLIDKKGDQLKLGETYQNVFQAMKKQNNNSYNIDFTWFDFHEECKKMKYGNISKLLKAQSVCNSLAHQGFTHIVASNSIPFNREFEVKQIQKGVFRTNCIDNLDRTNVIQSVFARQFLLKILYKFKLSEMPHGDPFEEFIPAFEKTYKIVWGDNGDILSTEYSGTNALKRDFTRTGKRTLAGNIDDGINTCKRFYLNNFCDGYSQDAHDYFLGTIHPKKNNFKKHSTMFVNLLLLGCIIMSLLLYSMSISFSMPKDHENSFGKIIFKGLVFIGILVLNVTSFLNSFKNSVIDLSTKQYH